MTRERERGMPIRWLIIRKALFLLSFTGYLADIIDSEGLWSGGLYVDDGERERWCKEICTRRRKQESHVKEASRRRGLILIEMLLFHCLHKKWYLNSIERYGFESVLHCTCSFATACCIDLPRFSFIYLFVFVWPQIQDPKWQPGISYCSG